MEILILVLLYYLSQNPDFAESVKPLMSQLKDSEQMLSFLKDLSKFSDTFSAFKNEKRQEPTSKTSENATHKSESATQKPENTPPSGEMKKENPQSPTTGIADDFIQKILDSYLQKH